MAEFNGQTGIWRTSETGVHYFIPDGVDPKQAWEEWSKERHYLQYWKVNDPDKYKYGLSSLSGISKKGYEKLIASGGLGEIRNYIDEKDWYKKVPEDIEEKMLNALGNITSIKNKKDFFEQLRDKVWGNGVNIDNWQVIKDAFDNEIKEKYGELIKPVIDKVNSIDIDNSYECFEEGLKLSTSLPESFKTKMLQNFENCQDEKCKIMVASMVNVFDLKYTNNEGTKEWSYYSELENSINILDRHNDTETLVHETFHAIFERYNVRESGLKEIMKKEMNKSKKIEEITNYFFDKAAKEQGYKDYKTIAEEANKALNNVNSIYSNELNKVSKKYGGKTFEAYRELEQILKNNEEYQKIYKDYEFKARTANLIKKDGRMQLSRYANLCDMISAATWNKSEYGYGHTGNYWGEDKWNQANEFFAEMAEMKATNDTEQYELIRKFAPESVKKFEELFENIFKNKEEPLKL